MDGHSAFVLVLVLITIALFHLSSLRQQIRDSQRGLATALDSVSRAARTQVHRTWQVNLAFLPIATLSVLTLFLRQTLVLTVVAFVLLGSIFVAVSIYAALNPQSLEQATPATIVVLVPMWAFSLLGLPTSVLLVWRAVEASAADNSGSQAKQSSFSRSGSDDKKFSIELNGRGRSSRSRNEANDLDIRYAQGVVSVTVDVEVKEEGEFDEDEKIVPNL